MPQFATPGWTIIQSLELIVGAIEFLRTLNMHASRAQFTNDWWDYWIEVHGYPDPEDWDNVRDYEQYVAEYRRRVFRTIRWHAFRGRHGTQTNFTRVRRMRSLMRELVDRIQEYREIGLDFHRARPAEFEHLFNHTLRGFSVMELRGSSYIR